MSEYVFSLSDISVSDGSAVVQINNSDSVFGVIEGSQFFVAGKIPVGVIESDTVNRTLTLISAWDQGDIANAAAKVIPLGAVVTLLTALERNRAAYQAFVDAGGGGSSSIEWGDIVAATLPDFVKRWGKYSEITDKPDYAQGWPSFENVTGKVSQEQLPEELDFDSELSHALSPPIDEESALNQRLIDYLKLKQTEVLPTNSPNNRKEILTDNIRGLVHVAMSNSWFTVPNSLQSRKFMVMPSNQYLQLNTAYSGEITLRVCPMGNGGNGLPGNPTLTNHKWHTVTVTVTNLSTIGDGFIGVIDFIQMGNRWETLDTDKSHFESLNAYYTRDNDASVSSPFLNFFLRSDGYWYSEDITPSTPHTLGGSWVKDGNTFTVTEATTSADALRFFSDAFDNYIMEILLVVNYVSGKLAITDGNEDPNVVYYAGTGRYITDDRIYFKRGGSSVTAAFTVESTRMRMPQYG
ncbi:hypothetical protein A6F57_19845 [Alteromonas stellipolaris]|uniref:hypothetical protein n=1 Tax=Alteromonas stellipolaris TaxID=233316 RepID=UPI0007B439B8|nr:hypothetical protein [Alteromonas stellipolaris]ANB27234.1 hypothetical protein A6F57_19845 [Alteromonas stellipolaris]